MLRDLLSSRLIQGGLVFFLLCVVGSLLYSWYVERTTEPELGPTPHPVVSPKPKIAPIVFQNDGLTNTPNETTDTQKHETTEAETRDETETIDLVDAFSPEDFVSAEEAPAEDVPISPFGFGPHPELPEGWSSNTFPTATAEHELLTRVQIKLISQGINAEGNTYGKHNLIYPIVKGTVYVEWDSSDGPAGVRKNISLMYGHPADVSRLAALRDEAGRTKRSFPESQVPSDIKLIPLTVGGINPYEFLKISLGGGTE